jgi:hypothetical protein
MARLVSSERWTSTFLTLKEAVAMNRGTVRGPTLRVHKKSGHAYARFDGEQFWFGRADERESHRRFAAFKAQWEVNDRRVTDDMREQLHRRRRARKREEVVTVELLVARYLEHLVARHTQRWRTDNLRRIELALGVVVELFAAEPAEQDRVHSEVQAVLDQIRKAKRAQAIHGSERIAADECADAELEARS